MMNIVKIGTKEYEVLTGDLILTRPKVIPLYTHYGVILVDGEDVLVLHNSPYNTNGSIIESIEDFLSDRNLHEIKPTALNYHTPDEIYRRFISTCKKGYHLLAYNCEHFVDCMLYQEEKSEQVRGWLKAALIASFLITINKRNANKCCA